MLFRIVTAISLLTNFVTASPFTLDKRGDVIIGYRRVSEVQATSYEKNGITWDPDWQQWGTQIGKGVYSSPTRDMYESLAADDAWYCVLSVDEASFDKVDKAWIPERDSNNKRLWMQTTEANLDNYIKTLETTWDPDTTIRLSIMPNGKDRSATQMCIPPGLIGKLKVHAVCKEHKAEVKDISVEYSTWKNVKGQKGT